MHLTKAAPITLSSGVHYGKHQVADLNLSGSDLLLGEESFLSELSDEQANLPTVESPISGGWHSGCVC